MTLPTLPRPGCEEAGAGFERMTASFCLKICEQSPLLVLCLCSSTLSSSGTGHERNETCICLVDQTRRDFDSLLAFAENFCCFNVHCVIWRTETRFIRYIHDLESSSGASACLVTWVRWAFRKMAQTLLRISIQLSTPNETRPDRSPSRVS